MRRFRIVATLVLLAAVAAAGGLSGVALGERMSERGIEELVIADPALAPDERPALRSAGGFTGFEGAPALIGAVVRTGTFEETAEGDVRVTQDGASVEISLREPDRLLRLAPAASPLLPGDIVLVRYGSDDEVTGILRVPAGLHGAE